MRKDFVALLQEAATNLPDNITQLIEPADIRNLIVNILDTIRPLYGAIQRAAVLAGVVLDPVTYVKLSPFDTTFATAAEMLADLPNGQVTRVLSGVVGATVQVQISGDVEGGNNDQVTVRLFANGLPTGFAQSVTCGGAGRQIGFSLTGITYVTADTAFDVRAVGNAGSYTFNKVNLICQNVPVSSFT